VKKKLLFVAAALLVLCACNRKDFVNKIEGTWKINTYLYSGQNLTHSFDTTNNGYQLVISSGYVYTETYKTYTFREDSIVRADTTGVDTNTNPHTYIITYDTLRFVDTTITPYASSGTWALLNSEEDLQLRTSGSNDSSVRIFNILKLTKSNLNLLNGNKEYDLTK
jgi:hypothetical protein